MTRLALLLAAGCGYAAWAVQNWDNRFDSMSRRKVLGENVVARCTEATFAAAPITQSNPPSADTAFSTAAAAAFSSPRSASKRGCDSVMTFQDGRFLLPCSRAR
jgi:hypothetical protein